MEEVEDEEMMHKVYEGVAHISRILEVDREIEEIILPLMALVDFVQQHLLMILVGDVSDHHGSPKIFTFLYLF